MSCKVQGRGLETGCQARECPRRGEHCWARDLRKGRCMTQRPGQSPEARVRVLPPGYMSGLAKSVGPALWSRENQILRETHNVTGNNNTVIINFPLQSGRRDILPVFVADVNSFPVVSFPFQSYAKQPYTLFIQPNTFYPAMQLLQQIQDCMYVSVCL